MPDVTLSKRVIAPISPAYKVSTGVNVLPVITNKVLTLNVFPFVLDATSAAFSQMALISFLPKPIPAPKIVTVPVLCHFTPTLSEQF